MDTNEAQKALKRSLSTPVMGQIGQSGDTVNRLRSLLSPKDTQKTPGRWLTAIVGLAIVILTIVIVIRGRGARGPCVYDPVYRKVTCRAKHLCSIPRDVNEAVVALHIGSRLDKNEHSFTTLTRANFSKYLHLQKLKLIKCGIEDIQTGTFSDLRVLRRLDLRYNRIQKITEGAFSGLTSLEYINLSNNPIQSLHDFTFRGLRIEDLIFAHNPALAEISAKVFAGAIIKQLTFHRCNLHSISAGTFSYIADSLHELQITYNAQPLHLPDDIFRGLTLERLNLAGNGLKEAEFVEHVMTRELNLGDNPLEDMDLEDSPKLKYTKKLIMSKTRLSDINKKDLIMLLNLQELDLSNNLLNVINASTFEHMDKLNILDLSGNAIEDFVGELEEFPAVEWLFLDNNSIRNLPSDLEPIFNGLKNLTLDENPLHCNCEMRWFVKWLETHREVLHKLNSVACETPESVNLTLVSDYGFQCRPPTILNATFDIDGLSLVCTAEGDPAPKLTWNSGLEVEKAVLPSRADKIIFQTRNALTVTRDGNYTCMAENVAGRDTVVVDTKKIPTSGLRFHVKSREIDILESPQGFFVTAALLALLAYLLRQS